MWLFDSLQIVLGKNEEDQKKRQVLFCLVHSETIQMMQF